MEKPYVISEELDMIDDEYIQKNAIDAFRRNLDEDLRGMGKNTEWVSSAALRQGITRLTQNTGLPIVSLDDRYVRSADGWIGMSCGADENLRDSGYAPRVGYPTIASQLDNVAKLGSSEIVLVDDVVFSGDMVARLDAELRERNVRIGAVVCGILVGEGGQKLNRMGIDVDAVRTFDDVDDELCERDFAVVTGSGRRIASLDANALYFCNRYGKPAEWASIPEDSVAAFAANSYRRSAQLLDPSANMNDIGRFYGIDNYVNAACALRNQAQRAEKETL